jgi:hypothetical protein
MRRHGVVCVAPCEPTEAGRARSSALAVHVCHLARQTRTTSRLMICVAAIVGQCGIISSSGDSSGRLGGCSEDACHVELCNKPVCC